MVARVWHRLVAQIALVVATLTRWWVPVPEALTLEPVPVAAASVPVDMPVVVDALVEKAQKKPRVPRVPREGDSSRWHFKGAILDRLVEYFSCLQRLRREDPEAYGLFRNVGLTIPADIFRNPTEEEFRQFKHATIGGVLLARDVDNPDPPDWISPSFFYFMKVKHPIRVAAAKGVVYRLTVVWDERRDNSRKYLASGTCYLDVTATTTQLLRQCTHEYSKFKTGKKHEQIELGGTQWAYPTWVKEVTAIKGGTDPSEWAGYLLRMAIATHALACEKIVVRATRGSQTANFGIDLHRCKYFFGDRDIDADAPNGKRRRIFHSVVEHERRIAKDRLTTVRGHFRGVRDFFWQGSRVHIVLPDLSGLLVPTFEGAKEFERGEPVGDYMGLPEAGREIATVLAE